MIEITDEKCCRGISHFYKKSVVGIKKLSLGVSLVPINFGVPPLGSMSVFRMLTEQVSCRSDHTKACPWYNQNKE